MNRKKKTFSFRVTVFGVFIFVSILISGMSLGIQHYFNRDLAKSAGKSTFYSMSKMINTRVKTLDNQSINILKILSRIHELHKFPSKVEETRALSILTASMTKSGNIYGIYVGYKTGDFFEIINLESSSNIRKKLGANLQDRWVLIKIITERGVRKKTYHYIGTDLKTRTTKTEITDYDPRDRPWYKNAHKSTFTVKTGPYIFSEINRPGVTYSINLQKGERVAALDISLEGMNEFLQQQRLPQNSKAFIFDKKGDIIANASCINSETSMENSCSIDLTKKEKEFLRKHPVIKASNELDWAPFDYAMSGTPRGYSIDLLNIIASKAGFRVEYINGYSWKELEGLFKKGQIDILHSLIKSPERERMGIFSEQYLSMPQVFAVKSEDSFPLSLSELKDKIVAIPKGWATGLYLGKNYPRIKLLYVDSVLSAMKAVASNRAYATLDSEPVLKYMMNSYFLKNLKLGGKPSELSGSSGQGLHFLVSLDKKILNSIINKTLGTITNREKKCLRDKWLGAGMKEAGYDCSDSEVHKNDLIKLIGSSVPVEKVQTVDINGKDYFAYASPVKSDFGSRDYLALLVPVKEAMKPYMSKITLSFIITMLLLLMLTPVVWYCASIIVRPINALALESGKVGERKYNEVKTVKSNITEIIGLSNSMVAMACSIKSHEKSLKELMDSFIKVIASAIDFKSPYTGGHCARVPELSIMLAKEANRCSEGPLKEFSLDTDEEWHEFRTAAWLHDCGKVTTPEHIVDKATKLECIYNRIHEIRMRFEVLWRDAEIDYLQRSADGGDEKILKKELELKHMEIQEEYDFLAECNVGSEFMEEEKLQFLQKISEKTWVRHLSDRIGLGNLEINRYPENEPELPCVEKLLSDKPEHIIEHFKNKSSYCENSSNGFKMPKPEFLYNRGEIYNLSIKHGTLTNEDRYKINEHITMTIKMLEQLPFPENMKRIPEYSGSHHETLTGTGYPRKLTEENISVPARILAIADIFEALTACDRPYKKAKTLSEALKILSFMVKDRALDYDLFKLFLENGIYIKYAEMFLDPKQIDEVNIRDYL